MKNTELPTPREDDLQQRSLSREQLPTAGGSYEVQPDGSLKLRERTRRPDETTDQQPE